MFNQRGISPLVSLSLHPTLPWLQGRGVFSKRHCWLTVKEATRQEPLGITIKDSDLLKETRLLMFITKLVSTDLMDTKL